MKRLLAGGPELPPPNEEEIITYSRVLLLIINLMGLGLLGIDRCYMGQCSCGILKALICAGGGTQALVVYMAMSSGSGQIGPCSMASAAIVAIWPGLDWALIL